jgi:Predicted periplasmic lipoprotein (DUF2279)
MRRRAIAVLIITGLRGLAAAQPDGLGAPDAPTPDPIVVPESNPTVVQPVTPDPQPAGKTPWLDLSPDQLQLALAESHHSKERNIAAPITLAAFYATFITFTYYAWYRKHKPLSQYKFGGDGWLGDETYAGGEDKFGHAWSTMVAARIGTEMLTQWGNYDRTKSILISTALAEALFIGVEVKDGFFYEFSFSDLAGDTAGALLALAFSFYPQIDEMFDFRVQYFPSSEYYHQVAGDKGPLGGRLNIAEDYSGQTYFLAYHLGSIKSLREMKYGTLARFVDVAIGFDTRGYKPTPDTGPLPPDQHHQNLFLGVSFNAQGFFDWVFDKPTQHDKLRKALHGTFDVFNLPFTGAGIPGLGIDHSPSKPVAVDGA